MEKAGKVSLTAATDDSGIQRFEIVAFGQTHRLSEVDMKSLRGFPLDSLRVTHSAGGMSKEDGHTVSFRLGRIFYDANKKLRQEAITVSVDESHKIWVTIETK